MFFEGFAVAHVPVPGGTVRLRHGGSGPPLLMTARMGRDRESFFLPVGTGDGDQHEYR